MCVGGYDNSVFPLLAGPSRCSVPTILPIAYSRNGNLYCGLRNVIIFYGLREHLSLSVREIKLFFLNGSQSYNMYLKPINVLSFY